MKTRKIIESTATPMWLHLQIFNHTTTFNTQFCSLKLPLFWCPQLLQFLIHLQWTLYTSNWFISLQKYQGH